MRYTVHWSVNDGRGGYPNIIAGLDFTDTRCRSYVEAIRVHAKIKGVKKILSISETHSKGKINGRPYRDYLVGYTAKNAPENKAPYTDGEVISKEVRVFGRSRGGR
jgi:hypothetical protein